MKQSILITLLFMSLQLTAQDHSRSAGIRGGISSGLTYRGYLDPQLAYEGLMSFRGNGLQFTVLRQHFEPVFWNISNGFFLTYGYGGHLGFTDSHSYEHLFRTVHNPERKFSPLLGMDGYLSLEYHFPGIPVQVGLDYKPFFEFSLYPYFRTCVWDLAFTLKYKF